ncbi:MAG: lytic transglycosylase domain-containing protein [Nanoarchaeota archaeon]|nr:lytic transglycosylase domain-containing protein [Nanoarchaeota archaeon]
MEKNKKINRKFLTDKVLIPLLGSSALLPLAASLFLSNQVTSCANIEKLNQRPYSIVNERPYQKPGTNLEDRFNLKSDQVSNASFSLPNLYTLGYSMDVINSVGRDLTNHLFISEKSTKNDVDVQNIEKDRKEFMTDKEMNSYIKSAYAKIRVPKYIEPNFVKSLINLESNKNIYAQSPRGAKGVMQLIPEAWNEVDNSNFYENCFNPQKNIEVGIKYLKWINNYLKVNYGDWDQIPDNEKRDLIAAAYNCGIGQLERKDWDINQTPRETLNYVDSLKASRD